MKTLSFKKGVFYILLTIYIFIVKYDCSEDATLCYKTKPLPRVKFKKYI